MTNHPEYRLDKFDNDLYHIEYLFCLLRKTHRAVTANL